MFTLLKKDAETGARRGRLETAHGAIETPIFMPVGTQGTVKSISPAELHGIGAQVILGNTYHLFVRPGMEIIEHFGGLHKFMRWDGPILTDSGGFQVFSLAKLRKISEKGVQFQNHLSGAATFIGPETSMGIQRSLGSDIAMLFDECPPYPCDARAAEESLNLTMRWAQRCKDWISKENTAGNGQMHFGIVQGSVYADLRERAARELVEIGFDGYAVGGVSVGEPEHEMMRAVENAVPFLPEDKPRYAMGLGTPSQLVEMVARGVDMFDCVLPTRIARNGTAYTSTGTMNLKNAKFAMDEAPIEEGCECPACSAEGGIGDGGHFTRGYLRHLVKAGELLAIRLISLHNLHFYLKLMERVRGAIEDGSFAEFRREMVARYTQKSQTSEEPK
ncbi:MAG: queuine tRNA-ribosyltransferase [Pseudoalteromonas tetraodonis]|jgi:queuine tRNA-ribosyltransferase